MKKPRTPRSLADLKRDPRVAEVFREAEPSFFDMYGRKPPARGYWLYLNDGWIDPGEGVSCLHEVSVQALCARLDDCISETL